MSKELKGNLGAFVTGFVIILISFNVAFSVYQASKVKECQCPYTSTQ